MKEKRIDEIIESLTRPLPLDISLKEILELARMAKARKRMVKEQQKAIKRPNA